MEYAAKSSLPAGSVATGQGLGRTAGILTRVRRCHSTANWAGLFIGSVSLSALGTRQSAAISKSKVPLPLPLSRSQNLFPSPAAFALPERDGGALRGGDGDDAPRAHPRLRELPGCRLPGVPRITGGLGFMGLGFRVWGLGFGV